MAALAIGLVLATLPHAPDIAHGQSEADVKIVSQSFLTPPTEIPLSEDVNVTLRKTLHNNGPYGPVGVNVTTDGTAPLDCTIAFQSQTPTDPVSLPVSVDVTVDEVWTIHCENPSSHTFSFDNAIAIVTGGVTDPDATNNSASTDLTVNAIAEADVKIVSQELIGSPTDIDVSEDVQVTLEKTVHNNGPYGPVDVSITASASAPADCTATFMSQAPANPVSLPVSVDVPVDEVWTIHCAQPSAHTFSFDNAIEILTPHIADPNAANNSASTQLTVYAIGQADVKIVSQEVHASDCVSPAPSEITQGTDVDVCLPKTVHNNGPYGPVDVSLSPAATPPANCTATADPSNPTSVDNLPVSVNVIVDEIWTLNCADVGAAVTFGFDNAIAVTTVHVSDPNAGNNSASTDLVVDVVATETDLVVELIKDENITVPEDLVHTETVTVRVTNGVGPTRAAVGLAQLSSDKNTCISHLVPEATDTLAEVFIGAQFLSRLTWEESLMDAYEVRDVTRDYEIVCSEPGSFPDIQQLVVNVDPLDMSELNWLNNQVQNFVSVESNPDVDGDTIPNADDNCPDDPNLDQTNTDVIVSPPGDELGDACDPDDDNDIVPDGEDAAALDAYVCRDIDNDTCDDCSQLGVADPLNDGSNTDWDRLCDAGDPDDDNDGLDDAVDPCSLDSDCDDDGYWDGVETDKGSQPLDANSTPEVCDGQDNDGDTLVDEDYDYNGNTVPDCSEEGLDSDGDTIPNTDDDDDDNDGFSDAVENWMGLDSLSDCGPGAWAPDVNNDAEVDILDVLHYAHKLEPKPYDRRYDLNTDGEVDILDVLLYKWELGKTCPNP